MLCALLLTCGGLAATDTSIARVNAPEQRDKPYLVLISVDGFRWDFADRYGADFNRALEAASTKSSLSLSARATVRPIWAVSRVCVRRVR